MSDQYELIHNTKWDNLIILDAARFDYFEREYSKFLKGKLEKAISPATCTVDWMKKVWNERYDLTYVSTWPCVNSKRIPCSYSIRLPGGKTKTIIGYKGWEHFSKIIDVWDFGWVDKLGTIPPWNVNKAVLKEGGRQRMVIHYMQPHMPYIGETKITFPMLKPNLAGEGAGFSRMSKKIREKKVELETLKRAYVDNLRLVLKWVAKLTPSLKGKTVITADHGELFRDLYHGGIVGPWHPSARAIALRGRGVGKDPRLREVPWFTVNI
ncbi:hypothetical protein ES702_07748 [subsurface metagenome]